jgi:hypothetical protein
MLSTKKTITIGFFTPPPDDASWVSRMVACWSASKNGGRRHVYSHVELRFSDGAVTSITQSPGYVHYETNRLLSNVGYRCFFELSIDASLELAMQQYAQECARQQISFNRLAMYWNFIPCLPPIYSNGQSFFCSEYITTLLQMCNACSELTPALTSPTDLYESLKGNPHVNVTFNRALAKATGRKLISE